MRADLRSARLQGLELLSQQGTCGQPVPDRHVVHCTSWACSACTGVSGPSSANGTRFLFRAINPRAGGSPPVLLSAGESLPAGLGSLEKPDAPSPGETPVMVCSWMGAGRQTSGLSCELGDEVPCVVPARRGLDMWKYINTNFWCIGC